MLEKCWNLCQNMRKAQTKPKNEVCAIPQNRNENFYYLLPKKKKLIEKTKKPKNGDPLKSGQKSAKTSFFAPGAHLRWNCQFLTIFDDFALISKCCRLLVSGPFQSSFFFVRKHRIEIFISILRNRAYLNFCIVRTPWVTKLILRLILPFFLDLPSLQPNANFFVFGFFYKIVSKTCKGRSQLSFKKKFSANGPLLTKL